MIFNDNIIMIWNISGFSFLVGKYIWAVPFKNEGGLDWKMIHNVWIRGQDKIK